MVKETLTPRCVLPLAKFCAITDVDSFVPSDTLTPYGPYFVGVPSRTTPLTAKLIARKSFSSLLQPTVMGGMLLH